MLCKKYIPTKLATSICEALDISTSVSSEALCCTHVDLFKKEITYSIFYSDTGRNKMFSKEYSGIIFSIQEGIPKDIYEPIAKLAIEQLEKFTYKP